MLKGQDAHLQFIFMTGVTKFSKVSLFSGLNQLKDITLSENKPRLPSNNSLKVSTNKLFPKRRGRERKNRAGCWLLFWICKRLLPYSA
jgi:hypothetical protein